MLTLHDIGKPDAVAITDMIAMQHTFTVPIVSETMQLLGYSQRERNIVTAIINDDPIGECIKSGDVTDDAIEQIESNAKDADMPAAEFVELLLVYYSCDAGSYTEDAGGQRSLDALFQFDRANRAMKFAPNVQNIVDQIKSRL